MATKEPSKSYILNLNAYLKDELSEPQFLLLKNDKHALYKVKKIPGVE